MNGRKFFHTTAAALLLSFLPVNALHEADGAAVSPGFAVDGAARLYVATSGNDRNPGSEKKPFATIARARDAVRELKKRTKGEITVLVRKGTYYFREPLVFESRDSGTPVQPITYAAHPGEFVTLSGGRKLECKWTPYKDGIMMCSLPELKQAKVSFTQLFVNGKRQIRARYPNYDAENPFPIGSGYVTLGKERTTDLPWPTKDWPLTEFKYDPETFSKKRWARPHEAVVNTFDDIYIGSLHWQVKDIDWKTRTMKLGKGGFHQNDLLFKMASSVYSAWQPDAPQRTRFFVENVFEELDAPGEWYLDQENGALYYMPAAGVDLGRSLVEASILKRLIEFRGSQEAPTTHITLSRFRITHTERTILDEYEALSGGDWTIHRGGAVFMEGTEDLTIEKCFFDAVGGNAVFVNNYNRRTRVYGNKFTEAGDSAVLLVGTKNKFLGSNKPFPAENTISNNLIHDCGVFGKQTAGVFCSISQKNTISHNLIFKMPRAAIVLNDGWGGGHVIEFNRIYDTMRETMEHGSISAWGRETAWCIRQSHSPSVSHRRGGGPEEKELWLLPDDERFTTVIRNNHIREYDIIEYGINLDDGCSNYHIYNNLTLGVGIKLREGIYRTVENNIMIHPIEPATLQIAYEDNHDKYRRNIIVATSKRPRPRVRFPAEYKHGGGGGKPGDIYSHVWPPLKGRIAEELDYNVFFSDVGEFFASAARREPPGRERYTFEQWQSLGYDQHSTFADPMFVDAANGDYRVKPESPALKLGFKNFDVSRAGLLPDFPKEWLESEAASKQK